MRPTNTRVVGIDVGVTGAAAMFAPDCSVASGLRWNVEDLPVLVDDRGKRELDAPGLRDWLMRCSPDHAYVELVSAMPSITDAHGFRRSMGATSAFRFGGMFYAVKAVVACCGIPATLVTPVKWKRDVGLATGADKEDSRRLALELFPELTGLLTRKKDQNRAEAALIAHYGAERFRLYG